MKKQISLLFYIGLQTALFGQDSLSITNFLAMTQQQSSIQYLQQKVDFQEQTDHSIGWFDRVEFRTETNDFEFSKQDFALRAKTNTQRQIDAQNQYHQANINLSQTEQALAFKKALEQRYKWLVKMVEINDDLAAKAKLKAIYNDKLKVLKQSTGNLNFKVKDLIRAEEDLQNIEVDILQLKHKKTQLNSGLTNFSKNLKSVFYTPNTLVTQAQIQALLSIKIIDESNHLALARKQNQVDLIDKEFEIEESEIKNPIQYIQIELNGGDNDGFSEYISFGVGFNLPFSGNKKLDLNELALDKIEEQGEYELLKNQLEISQSQLIERIKQLITEQQLLKNQLENSQAKYTYQRMLMIEEINPIDILDLKEILVKRENAIQKLDSQILKLFVEWLSVSDKMIEKPLKNYLLQTQETIRFN